MTKFEAGEGQFYVKQLTATERQVLSAFASGLNRYEIAESLNISQRTVGHALTAAKEKLCARSLARAAVLLSAAQPRFDLSHGDTTDTHPGN